MRAQGLVPTNGERLLYCHHVEGMGEELFHLVCQRDLEGVVAKRKFDPYLPSASWWKIRNRKYSQWAGREELFEREKHKEPVAGSHSCAIACAGLETIIYTSLFGCWRINAFGVEGIRGGAPWPLGSAHYLLRISVRRKVVR
jgi:hypothetical protein